MTGDRTDPPINSHNAIPLYGGGAWWVECTCGWVTKTYRHSVGAVVEHARHVAEAKTNQATTTKENT